MPYSLDDFLSESFKPKSNSGSVWSVAPFRPKAGDTSLLLLSEFTTDKEKEKDSSGIPYIVRFAEYTIEAPSGNWRDNETYAWTGPEDPIHPEFDYNGMDPNDDEFDEERAGLQPRVGLYVFNISAYNALVAHKDLEDMTDMEEEYLGDKYLRDRDNFSGVMRWVMKKSVGSDFWNIMGNLRAKSKRKGDDSMLTLKRWVWDLNRKDANITQYVLRRLENPTYEQLDDSVKEGVRKAVKEELPSLREFVELNKYNPDNPKGNNKVASKSANVNVKPAATQAATVTAGPQEDASGTEEVFVDGEGDGEGGFHF